MQAERSIEIEHNKPFSVDLHKLLQVTFKTKMFGFKKAAKVSSAEQTHRIYIPEQGAITGA